MALTKVSGGILDPGISVAGIVTATGFDGPFTGGSSSNITAGIITATGFDLNGNADISGSLTVGSGGLDLNGSGDISGNLVVHGNLTANGDFTTLNTTLREVELLRVDANSSAIAGIITQRGSGDIFSVYDTSTEVFKIADGGDVGIARSIFHLNDIDTHIGFSANNQVKITAGNEEVATFTNSVAAFNKKIQLRSSAVIDQEISESSATVPALRIRNTGNNTLVNFQNTNTKNTIIQWNDYVPNGQGNLIFRGLNSPNTEYARFTSSGNFNLSKDLDVTGNAGIGSLSVTGISTFNDNVIIPDNKKLILGTQSGRQLHLYHNMVGSSNHVIESTSSSNHLVLKATTINPRSDYFSFRNYAHNQDVFLIDADGQTKLFFNGNDKLTTTGYGVTVTGITSATSFTASESGITGEYSRNQIKWDRNSYNYIDCTNNSGQLVFRMGSSQTTAFSIDTNADTLFPTNRKIKMGSSGNSEIYSNNSHLYVTDNAAGYLHLQGNYGVVIQRHNGSENMIRALSNGAVELFYDESTYSTPKLKTTATGVTVDGEVKASQEYPLTKPVLDFNFAAEKKLDPRIQFTRDSVATFVDKKGIVRYASNNQPRFDHHPTTGVSLGLLLEKQSINYQPYSVDMSQGANNNGVTVENNAAIAPDGTMTASKITGGTDQNTSQRLGWGTQGVASNSYTMWSIWLKSEETSCIIQIYSNTYTFGADVITVELADGTMGGHSGEFGDTTFRYNLEKYPNKWWRLSWGGNGNAGGNSGGMYVAVVPALNSARAANTGSAHSKVWYAWGLQEEVGTQRKFATSYIPTYGGAVTRKADRGTIDGDDFDDFFDRYQGAVVHETSNAIQSWTGGGSGWEFNNDNYQSNVITNISSGYAHNNYPGGYIVANGESSDSGTNTSSLFGPNTATGNQAFNNGYYAGRTPSNSNVDYNRLYKTYTDGMSWDVSGSTNTLISAVGGFSASGTNTSNISFRNISKFELGSDATDMDGGYQKFSGRIKRWMYYDKALTATQLENLTAQDPVTYL